MSPVRVAAVQAAPVFLDRLAGPLVGEEGTVVADLDLNEARAAPRQSGAGGLDARPDLCRLTVEDQAAPAVTFAPAAEP